jgi:hypothetical protein
MKTYAPKGLHGDQLRALLDDLNASPLEVAKFLKVTERSVLRWLADGSAPFAVLAALWHETPRGRESAALDVGNELVITRAGKRIAQDAAAAVSAQVVRLLAISDTGAANDPLAAGPWSEKPQLPRLSRLTLDALGGGLGLGLEPSGGGSGGCHGKRSAHVARR